MEKFERTECSVEYALMMAKIDSTKRFVIGPTSAYYTKRETAAKRRELFPCVSREYSPEIREALDNLRRFKQRAD